MSEFLTLDQRDWIKGGAIFVISSVLSALQQMLSNGSFDVDFTLLLNIALTSTITYLLKNVLTDSQGKLGGKL